ncbi:MAG: hypothetical protein ABH865_01550 [Candidatus Omnitrophota bacterium]|nr:hypothetical protein [Candidatus Omnitrophota bacterium]
MDKAEALEELLKNLRITLNHAATYFIEHPMFIRAIDDLYARITTAVSLEIPLRVDIAPHSLHIAGMPFEGMRVYRELAEMFHSRKLKTVEFSPCTTPGELASFINIVARSPREVFAQGGIVRMIHHAGISTITVEELDYSQLLVGEGEEYKDIWTFLLGSAVTRRDTKDINALADNFPKILGKFKIQDFIDRDSLRENVMMFLDYLKHVEKEKFHACSRELGKAILRDKSVPSEEKLEKLKSLFAKISDEDFAHILGEQVLSAEDFDTASFNLFSRLIDRERHGKIASILTGVVSARSKEATPRMKKKVRELLTEVTTPFILEVYRNVFAPLLDTTLNESTVVFDRVELSRNYRFALLDLFGTESSAFVITRAREKIIAELYELVHARDFAAIEVILEFLFQLEREGVHRDFKAIYNHLSVLLEDFVLSGGLLPEKKLFIRAFTTSHHDSFFYVRKIVEEAKAQPEILELFFIFFPGGTEALCNALRRKYVDTVYLKKIIESLGEVDRPASLQVLRFMYSFSGPMLKREILNAMQYISVFDEDFMHIILRTGDTFSKKQALTIVRRSDSAMMRAISTLLNIFNPFGIRNARVRQNLRIIQELNLVEAASILLAFTKKSFWNISLCRDIKAVLARWQAGVDG